VETAGREVRTVRRMVQCIPLEFFQKRSDDVRGMGLWRDFGSALPFQTRLTQTKPVLQLSNEHGSQVKDQGRQQCCHNKHKNFPIDLHVMYLYFPVTPRTSSTLCAHLIFFFSFCQPSNTVRVQNYETPVLFTFLQRPLTSCLIGPNIPLDSSL